MIEGKLTVTPKLKEWLANQGKTLVVDVNSKGCNGNTIFWKLENRTLDWNKGIYFTRDIHKLIQEGLELEIDYLDTPLFEGVHINIKNKNVCGCGISVSLN